MKRLTRCIAILLCVCIFLSLFTAEVRIEAKNANVTENAIIMETVDKTPVRAYAQKKAQKYCTIEAGTLVLVVNCVKNRHNNYWYEVICGDEIGYVYEEHLMPHECSYEIDYTTENQTILFCECGQYELKGFGVQQTVMGELALAGGGTIVAAGLGELVLGGAVIVGTYYCLKTTIYFVVNAVGNMEIISAKTAGEIEKEYNNEENAEEIYYPALILDEKDALLIVWSSEMDIEEAADYLCIISKGTLNTKEVKTNIYTPEEEDAEELAQYVIRKKPWEFQAYGNSRGFRMCEIDQENGAPREGHYQHFHLFGWNDLKKKPHIFFGIPAVSIGAQI